MPRLEELYDGLKDHEDVDVMVEAAEALDREATADWLPTLFTWLKTPGDFFLREAVASPIARLAGMAALPDLLNAKRMGADEHHDNDGLNTIIVGLVETHESQSRPYLRTLANSTNERDRADAGWLLGFVREDSDRNLLIRLASDSSPRVRSRACGTLASFQDAPDIFACLIQSLSDTDEQVVISAASALGYLGNVQARKYLLALRDSASPRLLSIVDYSLGKLPQD